MTSQCLLISEVFPPKIGGSGRWFWDLYTKLDKDKVVVVTDHFEDSSPLDANSGLCIYRIPLSSNSWGFLSFVGLRYYFRVTRYVLNLLKKHDIESIHCGRTLPEGVVALIVKIFTGKPYLCYVHGEDIEMSRSSREFTILTSLVIKYASKLICNSENSARLLRKWRSAKEERIRVLYPGVDASYFCPESVSKDETLLPQKKVILTVSRLQPRKGHDVMIKAMPDILKQHPETHYVIVGSGRQFEYLSGLIDDLELTSNVSLLDECSDRQILQWYKRSDLFVLPNRQVGNDVEGFGIVLLEAQSCELAVIAGDSGGTRETLEAGTTGFVLDCRNPDALVSKISELLNNPEQLKAMGKSGRKLVLSKFDWPRVIDSAKKVFSEVAQIQRRK